MAIQSNLAVSTVHQDPVTKSQRITDSSGNLTSTVIDLDPWGAETGRSSNQAFQPQRYTSYMRDADGGDDAMHRRYGAYWSRFSQPDPYDGSYNFTDPQSLNRYAYVQNDPVNFVDPSGLNLAAPGGGGGSGLTCYVDGILTNCRTAFDYVSGGFATVAEGPGFYGDYVVINHEPITDGGRLYQSVFYLGFVPNGSTGDDFSGTDSETPDENPKPDPCAGKRLVDLNYDRVRRYRQGGRQSAREHITQRHLNRRSGASQYLGDFDDVQFANNLTFLFGTRYGSSNGGIVFELELPYWVGTDRSQSHRPTQFNLLRLEKDCQTVDTSHPGRML